jgi:hypothetical protein
MAAVSSQCSFVFVTPMQDMRKFCSLDLHQRRLLSLSSSPEFKTFCSRKMDLNTGISNYKVCCCGVLE